jgi:hypothetical protein
MIWPVNRFGRMQNCNLLQENE